MCVYNGAEYIQDQLDSIAAQSRLPDELVVCDDCSADHTPEIVEAFASEAAFPVRLVINEENLGYTKNLERAIGLSTGDIILPCDHDDVWHPEKLRRAETILSSSPRVGAVFSNAEIVDEHLNPLGYSLWQSADFNRSRQKRFMRGKVFEVMLQGNVMYGATTAFRATFKDLILPFSSDWAADEWIALLLSTVTELAVIHEPLIKYRQHSTSMSGARIQPFGQQLATVREPDRFTFYSGMIDQYASIYERMVEIDGHLRDPEDISRLEARIEHLRARAEMKGGVPRRLPSVLRELMTLRYHRYSNGWKSVAKDLLL